MKFDPSLEFARSMDAADPLASFRGRFHIPRHGDRDCYYFTGNSLGLQPRSVAGYLEQELEDWARLGVEGHFKARHPWLSYHESFPSLLAPVVGCRETEVVAMNSLTVNLHLLLVSFYRPTSVRFRILCEARAFPSDQYAFESQVRWHGYDPEEAIIEVAPRPGEHTLRTEDICSVIDRNRDSLALVVLGGVNYYTGQRYDMAAITAAAHRAGAYAGFDLAHAAGNVELKLHDWQVDFACWCSYKYLNSGPGGVAGIYIHERHAANGAMPRFAGWWGHNKESRFRMEKGFEPIPTAEGWQLSNAPVCSMAAHRAALEEFQAAGMERLHAKRRQLTAYLRYLLDEICRTTGSATIEVITPAAPDACGCQVSLLITNEGLRVFDALTSEGAIADWREPDVIRVAPVPLYNRYEDCWQLVRILRTALA
ncbi:MAG: kynureninase [Bacteroidota bacterium]|jgi:kynureninase